MVKGIFSRFGRLWTKRSVYKHMSLQVRIRHDMLTFSLAMVCMTSSGGVPSNSVMIEN